MKVILTRAELIQLARTSSKFSREIDNADWLIESFTDEDVVIERFTKMFPEFKYDSKIDLYFAEVTQEKYLAILKLADSNVGDLVRMVKSIWMMVQAFNGSLKRIGREIESIVKR